MKTKIMKTKIIDSSSIVKGNRTLTGIAVSEGVGLGNAVCVRAASLDYSGVTFSGGDAERLRLRAAIGEFEQRTAAMAAHIEKSVGQKEAEIITGQIAMLADPCMRAQMEKAIDSGKCCEAAVDSVCTAYADMFDGIGDELMCQRASDVRDLMSRLMSILLGVDNGDLSALPPGSVLVARDLTPSMTVGLDRKNIAAIVTETGGKTSHSAILSRALGIPAVLSVPGALDLINNGDEIIVDGCEGVVIISPDESNKRAYLERRQEYLAHKDSLNVYKNRATVDADGKRYHLYANIGSVTEAEAASVSGAEGIGLFRTECLFMDSTTAPDEEKQLNAYSSVSRIMSGREVIIRTLDVGGDKDIEYLSMEREDNPFLGNRAIRYCLSHPEIFKIQLRALLRAGAREQNIRIMLPMVTCVDEIRATRELLAQCKQELSKEGKPYDENIALGIMVETPAAALTADLLADESDFFSIGTNDLTQYIMAVDRGNIQVEKLYSPLQPAVLRAIRSVIQAAKRAGIPVGMCGEAAAEPLLIPLLMAWGLDEFSVSSISVTATRANISRWGNEAACGLEQKVMNCRQATDVATCLRSHAPN